MSQLQTNKRIAILATDGFEQSELESPLKALLEAGADARIVSLQHGKIQGMKHAEKGDQFEVDQTLSEVTPDDFDALVLPGGLMNPDTLRATPKAVQFVGGFVSAGKPIAAICHGPWLLIEADAVRGRKLTSWPAIQTDVRNAGGEWVDEEVVCDNGLITSRSPDDLPAFNRMMLEVFLATPAGGSGEAAPIDVGTPEEIAFTPPFHSPLGSPA